MASGSSWIFASVWRDESSLSLCFCDYCGTVKATFGVPSLSDPLELKAAHRHLFVSCSIYILCSCVCVCGRLCKQQFSCVKSRIYDQFFHKNTFAHFNHYIDGSMLLLDVRLPVCMFMGCQPHLPNSVTFYFCFNHNTATRRRHTHTHAEMWG